MKKISEYIYKHTLDVKLILLLLPFVSVLVMCMSQGVHLKDIYFPASSWNDELAYYKLIEGVLEYGAPQGYWGYNESTAKIGTFGAWSPVLLLPMLAYAKVLGWNFFSPIICNICIMTYAMLVFIVCVKPTRLQGWLITLLYMSFAPITRYMLSTMSDVMLWAMCIIFVSLCYYILNQPNSKKICVIFMYFICSYLTLCRPYFILCWLVSLYVINHSNVKRKKLHFVLHISLLFIVLVGYFCVNYYLCASYFTALIRTDWLTLLLSNPIKGIYNLLCLIVSSLKTVAIYIGNGLAQGSFEGGVWLVFCLLLCYFGYKYYVSQRRCWMYILFLYILMLLAVICFYDIRVGSRHIICFVVAGFFIVTTCEQCKRYALCFAVVCLYLFVARGTDEFIYTIPIRDDILVSEYSTMKEKLENEMTVSQENAWDNTVISIYGGSSNTNWRRLYALPKGMGVNLCYEQYVLDNFFDLHSRYIVTATGGEIYQLCDKNKKELLYEDVGTSVWQIRE